MRSDDLEQLIDGLPETRQELLSVARSLDIEGRSQTAVELLETAVRRAPSQPLRKALAALYAQVGRSAGCASVLEAVVEREPGDIPSLILLAEAKVECGDFEHARRYLTKAESLGASRTGLMQVRRKLKRARDAAASTQPTHDAPPKSSTGPGPPPLPGDAAPDAPDDPETEEMRSPLLDASPTDSGLESVESSIFEDGTFSNLSSQSLAEGAAALEDNEESSVFDTLVNHDYDDDDPDRSFDALLSDLGVPVEGPQTLDEDDATIDRSADQSLLEDARKAGGHDEAHPDEKTEAVDLDSVEARSVVEDSHASSDVPDEPFDEAPTEVSGEADSEETTDPLAAPNPLTRDAPAGPDGPSGDLDEAPTEMSAPPAHAALSGAGPSLVEDSEAEDVPADDFPDEVPTQIEPEQKKKRRRETQRHKALSREQAGMTKKPAGASGNDSARDDRTLSDRPARKRQPSGQGPAAPSERRDAAPPDSSRRQSQQPRRRQPSGPNPGARRGDNRPGEGRERSSGAPSMRSGPVPNPSGGRADRNGSPFQQGSVPHPSRSGGGQQQSGGGAAAQARDKARQVWSKLTDGWSSVSQKMPGSTLLVAAAVVVVILMGTLLGVGAWAMSSLGDRIDDGLREARRLERVDTYAGYLQAGKTLSETKSASSFAGSTFDAFVDDMGLTSSRVEASRATAAAELALVAAMLEYRYETMDSRDSLERIEAAEAIAGSDPRLPAARAYRLMSDGSFAEARETLESAIAEYPRSKELAAAKTELELAMGYPDAAFAASSLFRDTKQYDVYPRFLMGRVALAQKKSTAENHFRRILRDSSPKHLSARIEQSYAIRLDDQQPSTLKKSRDLVSPVLGKFSDRASPMQKSLAHVALGETYRAEDTPKQAESQLEKALEISRSRAEIYVPLVDFYLSQGRTDKALETIDRATETAYGTRGLSLRRARAQYQSGEFEKALATLDEIGIDTHDAALLAGHSHLDLGQADDARWLFEKASKISDSAFEAKAFALLARARTAEKLDDAWLDKVDALVDESRDDPAVLRASGLLLLEFAEAETGYSEQRELFEDAVEELSKAAELRESWYVVEYDLCRAQMRLGEGSQAFAHCKRGRKLNERYRPGVRTAIQLAVLRGRYDDASSIATELGEAFPNAPDVSFAVVRALVAQRDVEAAEEQINRWAGKPVAESHDAKMAEGLLAFRRNKFRSALGYFQRAHETTPRDVEAAVYYAWTAARLGEDDGEDILRDRLSDPLWGPRAWQALGELRRRQGELRDARENLSEALEDYRKSIAPKWRESESYAELARTWADERDWDHYLTRRFVSRAVTRGDAESVPAHMIRGEYKLEKRRRERDEAADHFERVLAREPYNCEAIDYLLDIYDDLRRDDDEERIEELEDKYCE